MAQIYDSNPVEESKLFKFESMDEYKQYEEEIKDYEEENLNGNKSLNDEEYAIFIENYNPIQESDFVLIGDFLGGNSENDQFMLYEVKKKNGEKKPIFIKNGTEDDLLALYNSVKSLSTGSVERIRIMKDNTEKRNNSSTKKRRRSSSKK